MALVELKRKRTRTMKVLDDGNGTRLYRCHLGRQHYHDGTRLRDIDTTIIGGHVDKNGAQLVLPDFADGEFQYHRRDHNFNIRIPDAGHVGWVPTADVYGTMEKGRRYTDALGQGVHFEVRAKHSAFQKLFVIDAPPADTSVPLVLEMELLEAPRVVEELDASRTKLGDVSDTDGMGTARTITDRILLFRGGGFTSEISRPICWDSSRGRNRPWPVGIRIYRAGGKRYLQKIVPSRVLQRAVYPLYVDDPVRYDATAGDGTVEGASYAAWDTAHDATSGSAYYAVNESEVATFHDPSADFKFMRSFYPIDTSGITDGDTVTAATFYGYGFASANVDNDGNDFLSIVQTDQASTTVLVDDDYNNCGATDNPTEAVDNGDRLDIGSFSTSGYNTWVFNATGLTWVDKTGVTMLGMREGHDILDDPMTVGADYNANQGKLRTSEQTGTSEDPYLDVTAEAGGAGDPFVTVLIKPASQAP